jgi:S1-C subfamily serine protease
MDAGIGGAKHCIFHVHVQGDDGQPDIVDFAVETPVIARQWVDGLSMLLHTGSVGIGLQVKQSAGKFIVILALDGSPSAACGQFNNDDIIETVDTQPLTDKTTFAEYEALVLGPDNSPISITLNRGGKKVSAAAPHPPPPLRVSASCARRWRSSCDAAPLSPPSRSF